MEFPKAPELSENCKKTLDEHGYDKCKKAYDLVMEDKSLNMQTKINWQNISEKLDISINEAMTIFHVGMTLSMQETQPESERIWKDYNANKHKLPSCPKKECEGKLHITVAQAEEFNGMYVCDGCNTMFKKKEKKTH